MLRYLLGVLFRALLMVLAGLWLFAERGHLLRPSTRAFIRAALAQGVQRKGLRRTLQDFAHAYLYGRWSDQYIGLAINRVFPALALPEGDRAWADQYHGKVLTHDQATRLITIDQPIERCNMEQVIPYQTARDLVLNAPPEIAAYECPCRSARQHPCEPTQVCMIIGQPFVDFILEHNPQSSRRLSQEEALILLREEHQRGHVHTAYFKDVMLDRFYAICNCCSCCCGGMEAMRRGVPMVASSGYVAQVDAGLCSACGTCENACPFTAITVDQYATVHWELCMGCGVCEDQCPNEAVVLARDERKGSPLDVRLLETAGASYPTPGGVGVGGAASSGTNSKATR